MSEAPIYVFGRTGQVARALAERCAEHGIEWVGLGREQCDCTEPRQIVAAIAAAPEGAVIVNAVAYTAVDKAENDVSAARSVNAIAPGIMARECASRDLPFIHLSTDYVYDGQKPEPYVEGDLTRPLGVYGQTKLAGEQAVLETSAKAVILRTSWVYSAYGSNFVKTMLRVGADRDTLNVVNDQIGCPTSAVDIATAILVVAKALANGDKVAGIYHLAGGGAASWADFADEIFAIQEPIWRRRPSVHPIPSSEYPTPAKRPANSLLNTEKFERTFKFTSPPWQQSLRAVLADIAQKSSGALPPAA